MNDPELTVDLVEKRVEYYDRINDPAGKKIYLEKVQEELRMAVALCQSGRPKGLSLSESQFLRSFVKAEKARAEDEFQRWCIEKTRGHTKEEVRAAKAVLRTYEKLSQDHTGHPGITKVWEGANEDLGKGRRSEHVQQLLAREELGYPEGHGSGTDEKVESLLTIAQSFTENVSRKEKHLSRED